MENSISYSFDIFLSFANLNKQVAQEVASKLREYDLQVFYSNDSLRNSIGLSFSEKISDALERSQHFVMLCTPEAMQSKWVRIECESFFNHFRDGENRRLIILKGENFDEKTLPAIYRNFQYAENVNDIIYSLGVKHSKNKTSASTISYTSPTIEHINDENFENHIILDRTDLRDILIPDIDKKQKLIESQVSQPHEENRKGSQKKNKESIFSEIKIKRVILIASIIFLLLILGFFLFDGEVKQKTQQNEVPIIKLVPEVDSLGRNWGFKDSKTGKNAIPLQYDWVDSIHNGVFRFSKNKKFGIGDSTGKILIPANYDFIEEYNENRAAVIVNKKKGFVDDKGKVVVPPLYDDVNRFEDGMAVVKLGKRYGFINSDGDEVIKAKYDFADDFENGFAIVIIEQSIDDIRYGYINKMGLEIIKPIYDFLSPFENGLSQFKKNGKYGFFNQSGKEVTKKLYDDLGWFSKGIAKIFVNGKWGYIDREGTEVIKPIYTELGDFNDGLALVKLNGKVGYISESGKAIIEPKYNDGKDFNNGLATVQIHGKWGYINREGTEVIKSIYSKLSDSSYFIDDYAAIYLDNRCGFIDKTGVTKIPFIFDTAESFHKGFSKVVINGKTGIIDKSGKFVVQPVYDEIIYYECSPEQTAIGELHSKWRYINFKGNNTSITPAEFDEFSCFADGYAKVNQGGKVGFINSKGKIVIPIIYDDAHVCKNGLFYVTQKKNGFYINRYGIQVTSKTL